MSRPAGMYQTLCRSGSRRCVSGRKGARLVEVRHIGDVALLRYALSPRFDGVVRDGHHDPS